MPFKKNSSINYFHFGILLRMRENTCIIFAFHLPLHCVIFALLLSFTVHTPFFHALEDMNIAYCRLLSV